MAPKSKAKAKGAGKGGVMPNRVQNAAALRAAAGAAGKVGGPGTGGPRIQNAAGLRSGFSEIANSPDGADPNPHTVPKCVECSHCGWPVYPRDARVATKKTFERAGIDRDFDAKLKEKQEKKKAAEAREAAEDDDLDIGEDDEEEAEDDDESIGTVELLESKVNDLEEQVSELQGNVDALTSENKELQQNIEDLEEGLAAAEEKIEMLEEAEARWREKNSILRMENADLKQYIARLGSRVGDLESDMIKKLLEIQSLKEKMARAERRRALMLQEMEKKLAALTGGTLVQCLLNLWRTDTASEKKKREMQDMEATRRLEVGELSDQLIMERERVLSLDATTKRLRGSLKAAAQRMLMKVFSTAQKPWADGHALRTWCAAHPVMRIENELIRTTQDLEETKIRFDTEQDKSKQLGEDLEDVTDKYQKTSQELDTMNNSYAALAEKLAEFTGSMGAQADEIRRQAEERNRLAKEALEREIRAEMQREINRLMEEWKEQRVQLEDEIGSLQAMIESIKRGVGSASGGDDTKDRVVPKGQGVLCVGCLRQIVNRGVQKLPPVSKPKPRPKTNEDKARRLFFQEELLGMPDPDDILHAEFWKCRRDPMVGLKYAAVSADPPWPASARSASTSKLPSITTKVFKEKVFQPRAFR